MSTAAAFQFQRSFPLCLAESASPTVPSGFDSVDVSLADAMAFWWNLKDLQFTSSGTEGAASINWTTTLGAVESLPFTPSNIAMRYGSYYTLGSPATPARPPIRRICESGNPLRALGFSFQGSGRWIIGEFQYLGVVSSSGLVRIAYFFRLQHEVYSPAYRLVAAVSPAQVAGFGATGSPASSGTISILGISFNWQGGGINWDTNAWTASTASLSATSAAFTY